jgi:F-type H+-transporting ATPase subunit alpha
MLHFGDGRLGYAAGLGADDIACVLLDDSRRLRAGEAVQRSGDVLRVPVGPALLGRVLDPLGRPLDGGAPVEAADWLPAERPAPGILERELVHEPVHTGTWWWTRCSRSGAARASSSSATAAPARRRWHSTRCWPSATERSASTSRWGRKRVGGGGHRGRAPPRRAAALHLVVASGRCPRPAMAGAFRGLFHGQYFRDRGGHAWW